MYVKSEKKLTILSNTHTHKHMIYAHANALSVFLMGNIVSVEKTPKLAAIEHYDAYAHMYFIYFAAVRKVWESDKEIALAL